MEQKERLQRFLTPILATERETIVSVNFLNCDPNLDMIPIIVLSTRRKRVRDCANEMFAPVGTYKKGAKSDSAYTRCMGRRGIRFRATLP